MTKINWDESAELDKLAELSIKTGWRCNLGRTLSLPPRLRPRHLCVNWRSMHTKRVQALYPILYRPRGGFGPLQNADKASFEKATDWLFDGMANAFDQNTARLAVVGDDPMLLAEQNPEDVGQANKAVSKASSSVRERITRFDVNWNIIAWPGTQWAKRVFPDLSDEDAQIALADAIFAASRVTMPDPISAWDEHNKRLRERTNWLNTQNFAALHFYGDGTDLMVGLAQDHEWMGGHRSLEMALRAIQTSQQKRSLRLRMPQT